MRLGRKRQSLLVEKGLVDPAALDTLVDIYERKIGPRNGARVIAKPWSDLEYKRRSRHRRRVYGRADGWNRCCNLRNLWRGDGGRRCRVRSMDPTRCVSDAGTQDFHAHRDLRHNGFDCMLRIRRAPCRAMAGRRGSRLLWSFEPNDVYDRYYPRRPARGRPLGRRAKPRGSGRRHRFADHDRIDRRSHGRLELGIRGCRSRATDRNGGLGRDRSSSRAVGLDGRTRIGTRHCGSTRLATVATAQIAARLSRALCRKRPFGL